MAPCRQVHLVAMVGEVSRVIWWRPLPKVTTRGLWRGGASRSHRRLMLQLVVALALVLGLVLMLVLQVVLVMLLVLMLLMTSSPSP